MLTPAIRERKFFMPQSRTLALLENDSLVTGAPRDSLAVKIFKQWNCIFARDSRQPLELRHVNEPLRLMLQGEILKQLPQAI
jgi:hypothetical protein